MQRQQATAKARTVEAKGNDLHSIAGVARRICCAPSIVPALGLFTIQYRPTPSPSPQSEKGQGYRSYKLTGRASWPLYSLSKQRTSCISRKTAPLSLSLSAAWETSTQENYRTPHTHTHTRQTEQQNVERAKHHHHPVRFWGSGARINNKYNTTNAPSFFAC